MMKYLYWALLLIPSLLAGLIGIILSPIACMFIKRELYTTTVKRYGKIKLTLNRDRLVWWLTWFDTDDNASDEYFYGMYGNTITVTQAYYDTHRVYRWWCRVRWLQRNSAYTFNRKFFGIAPDSPLRWQYKGQYPLLFGYFNDVNCGWKSHKGIQKLMLAGRVIGIRKNQP